MYVHVHGLLSSFELFFPNINNNILITKLAYFNSKSFIMIILFSLKDRLKKKNV